MSAHHDADLRVGRTTSVVLWALVVAVAAGTLAGLVALRPDGEVVRATRVENPYAGLRLLDGTVTGTRALPCDQVGAESGGEGVAPTGAGLGGIVLCGVVVAGLGVLNDVTVTQASAVWEVEAHAPRLGVRALFARGMRVGRDHLASTVYTIVFAYAGAALPTLLLVDLYAQPVGQVLTGGDVAEEVVRTLVGSVGLVLAIPLTTLVAALVASRGRPVRRAADGGPAAADRTPVDAVTV